MVNCQGPLNLYLLGSLPSFALIIVLGLERWFRHLRLGERGLLSSIENSLKGSA